MTTLVPMAKASVPARRKPVLRLVIGLACLALASAPYYMGIAGNGSAWYPPTALALLVAGLAFLVASIIALPINAWRQLVVRRPGQANRLHLVFGAFLMVGAGIYGCWLAIAGLASSQAPVLSRHAGTFPRSESEFAFWFSLSLHFGMGLFLICAAIYMLNRRWTREP